MELDRIDFEILRLLQDNARLMNKQLSERIGLAPSTCHERVKRLWSEGVIIGSQTNIDASKLGYNLLAVIFVNLSKKGQIAIDELMDQLIAIPEIQKINLVTGRYDLIIDVIAIDMDHLKKLTYELLTESEKITRHETSIVYDHRQQFRVPVTDKCHPGHLAGRS